ncbi:40911_t:CDS:2 [Gigaspora margarita]|uniref:40911_t:CDS:1 n=1 Tax=Gigaspora margarita TaxID=4874 RepID=A0ABN7UJ23_GIGMA|nr:40911_t:CDS:2 [Gigaspora margarita]
MTMAFNEQNRFQFTQLENMIWHSLDNHLYRNAIFLAERLHAQEQNNENSRFLLATCYYRNGQKKAAYMLLKEAQSIKCKYLFAKCCLDLNKAGEGEEKLRSVLSEIDEASSDTFSNIPKNNQPDASSVLCLLGALCKQAKRPEEAAQHYLCCIKKNPYMWEAFESLCQLGKSNQVEIDEIFQSTTEKSTRIPCADLFRNSQMFVPPSTTSVTDNREKKRSRIANDERILTGIDDEKKWSKIMREGKTITNVENEVTEALQKTTLSPQINMEFMGNLDKVDDTNLKSDNEFLLLLKQLAKGYGYLSQYECAKAIEVFMELPPSQYNTAWVQSHMAKAHFEMVDYSMAEQYFQKARQLESYRLEDMELYSTTLWHLRKDKDLSALAHELIEFERRSPQTWCAVGNCFSRQQEHDVALKCFRRAIQLDQSFTYAHTLSGHESMANANYEDAQKHFRNALNTNNRHYNALYGLANYYITCGKTCEAEQNYRMAMKINPNHAVLMCCLGKVLEKMGKVDEARSLYDRACQVTPQTPLAIFKKAKSLFRDKQYEGALAELEKLKKAVPNEPKVYFLMARIYKSMGERAKATHNFTLVLTMDPKMSHIVKNAIEHIESSGI